MSSPSVITSFANPPVGFCPTTFQETVDELNDLITSSIQGDYKIYVSGNSTPDVNDQDKIWQKEDAQGRPLGTFKYYGGSWRRTYNVPIGTIVMFSGNPTGLFDGTGLGVVGTDWDGYALANGNNGTANLSDKFLIAARLDDVGLSKYSSGWQTNVGGSGSKTGGNATITLDDPHTYRPARAAFQVGKWQADGNAPVAPATPALYGNPHPEIVNNVVELIAADPGQPTPAAITTLPPYYAIALAVFVGYS